MHNIEVIKVRKACEHNLKGVDVDIPKYKFVVITGVSGSGKSSLAFDTVYAEGHRRYMESLSSHSKQFWEEHLKPDVESITGLSPAIAIDQKTGGKNSRSTIATATEIYDFMRVLFARLGQPYSPITNKPLVKQTKEEIVDAVMNLASGTEVEILATVSSDKKGYKSSLLYLKQQGLTHIKVDGIVFKFEDLHLLNKEKKHVVEVIIAKVILEEHKKEEISCLIAEALRLSNGHISVQITSLPSGKSDHHPECESSQEEKKPPLEIGSKLKFSEKLICSLSGFNFSEVEPKMFSFNNPQGACPHCKGLGTSPVWDPKLIIPDPFLPLGKGAISPWRSDKTEQRGIASRSAKIYRQILDSLSNHYNFSLETPFEALDDAIKNIILYGSGKEIIKFTYEEGIRHRVMQEPFEGVVPILEKLSQQTAGESVSTGLSAYQSLKKCDVCHGHRLRPEILQIKLGGLHIGEVCAMTINSVASWFKQLVSNMTSARQIPVADVLIKEIEKRLSLLNDIGLGYLALSRGTSTLSGGERQRIKLASQIGSELCGVLYVLDEPTVGLHKCDTENLLLSLYRLRDLGNTVIVVEHDEDIMRAADYIIDVGLGAGTQGGHIIAVGTLKQIMQSTTSITGQYLSGSLGIPIPQIRRPLNEEKFPKLKIIGARANNLKNINISIPLNRFVCITGVSGSGKSTLMIKTLYAAAIKRLHGAKIIPAEHSDILGLEYLDKVVEVDQSPIGRTPRSNPATYTAAFTYIREFFASLKIAQTLGYNASHFSFNVRGGRCEACEGDGVKKIEMHFLPDVYVECEECGGTRYDKDILQIRHNGYSIADVLKMTVDEATVFFQNMPLIYAKLHTLQEVGLGYMLVGQAATTLSGGEAQRIKLAKELARKSTGRTLYILDEPTTGLHSSDISKLLSVLHKLVDQGNSVLVIEHNLDVIKTADYILDMGPCGGNDGGFVTATGTPEEIIENLQSSTGRYLKEVMSRGI